MSDVLIKGMEMPKNCSDCPMCYDMIECTVAEPIIDFYKEELKKFDFCTERHPRCPLKACDAIEELQAAEKKYLANISALETENQHLKRERKWIPVTERLPDIGHRVLVAGRMKYRWEGTYFHFVDAACFTDNENFETFNDWYEGQDEFKITHWMPLPASPEED